MIKVFAILFAMVAVFVSLSMAQDDNPCCNPNLEGKCEIACGWPARTD